MADNNVTKIYELRTLGYADIINELDAVNEAFIQIYKTKQQLNNQRIDPQDAEALQQQRIQLQQLRLEEGKLILQRQELINEAKTLQVARQQEINDNKKQGQSVTDLVGSYNALNKERKELYNLLKATPEGSGINFRDEVLTYDQAIQKLQQLSAAEQNFRRQFTQDKVLVGEYTTGIIQAFKQAGIDDLVSGQVTKAQSRLSELNNSFIVLKEELSNIGVNGAGGLELIEKELIANRTEAQALQQQIGRLTTELRGSGDVGNQITTSLNAGFKELKGQVGQLLISYFGIQAAFQGIVSGIETTKELSDQTTNLEVELGKAKGGVSGIVDELAKIDTRTKLTGLENIANIAAKAGVSAENLVAVTQAIDKIKIAFGKDFGDVEQGTESLVKLVNIFEGTDQVNGDNLLKTGNAIRVLANESVASVPFLNDFSKRMAGLKGISDITLPSVLGLASGFEQFGQSAEVSSTALVRIIPKLATDLEKYANIAGLTKDKFKELINTNPAEALLQVAQGLAKDKTGLDQLASSFADAQLGTTRVTAVLGVLADHADDFRKSIDTANQAFQNTGELEDAFAAKNENLAATIDKIGKKFSDAANNKGFQTLLLVIGSTIAFLISNVNILIPVLLTAIGLTNTLAGSLVRLSAAWALDTAAMITEYAQLVISNTVKAAAATITNIYTAATIRSAAATGVAAVAYRALAAAITFVTSPLGIAVGIFTGLVTIFGILSVSANNAVASFSALARQQKANTQVLAQSTSLIGDQIVKLDSWVAVIKNAATGADTKRIALQKLIEINPAFREALQGQTIDLQKLDETYKKVTESIRAQAQAQAATQLTAEKQKDVLTVTTLRQRIEQEFAQQQGPLVGFLTNDFSEQELNLIKNLKSVNFTRGLFGGGSASFQRDDFQTVLAELKSKETQAISTYEDYLKVLQQKQQQLAALESNLQKQSDGQAKQQSQSFEVDIATLRGQIDQLNDAIDSFKGSQKDLDALVAKRNALQQQLDKALGEQQTYRGAKLTGDQKDALKNIDALRDEQLAEENLYHQQGKDSEENYLREILDINQAAIDAKLALLKGSNAEERKIISQLQLDRIELEQETDNKIFQLRVASLKQQRDATINNANEGAKNIEEDPTASPSVKAQARLNADKAILAAEESFQSQILALEKTTGAKEIELNRQVADEISKTRIKLIADQKAADEAALKDIIDAGNRDVAQFKSIIEAQKAAIANSDTLTQPQKDDKTAALDKEENIGVLAREVASLQNQLPVYKSLLDQKKIADTDYYNFLTQLSEKEKQLADATETIWEQRYKNVTDFKSLLTQSIAQLFNLQIGSNADKALAEGISQTYSTLTQVMNNYFNAEEERIKANLALKEQVIDQDAKEAESRAQSTAEIQSIEDQAAAKKKQAQQQALAETKKAKSAEAKISFLTELANIWSSVWKYGPIAGAVLGAALTALAYVRYNSEISQINSATAAEGLNLGDMSAMPARGGKIGGRRHGRGGAPFVFRGHQYEAEAKEISIVRTKDAPRNKLFSITGNQTQIASALNEIGGGRRFAAGAQIQSFDYGGSLGNNLSAPDFNATTATQAINNAAGIEDKFDQLSNDIKTLAREQSARIDRLQVQQVTKSVTDAQKKTVKQKNIGSL